MTRKLAVCSIMALAVLGGTVQAQSPYRVEYFSNANTAGAPDATLRLDNDGAAGNTNLCADIFVFDEFEELSECCSCLETPDGLRTLSMNTDLTNNPLTGLILTTGAIKIVAASTSGGTCPVPYRVTTVANAEIQAWATHIQNISFTVTETASQASALNSTEQSHLAAQCGAIEKVSSGHGVCVCGSGS